jgi:cyclic pyranopterin monophosphate synthase
MCVGCFQKSSSTEHQTSHRNATTQGVEAHRWFGARPPQGWGESSTGPIRPTEADVDSLNREIFEFFGTTHASAADNKDAELFPPAQAEGASAGPSGQQDQNKVQATAGAISHRLTHVDASGRARMVDVSQVSNPWTNTLNTHNNYEIQHTTPSIDTIFPSYVSPAQKPHTSRSATASARVLLGPDVFRLVAANRLAKGDVLTVAQLAGIMGAKHTASLIPLCHPITLSSVSVELALAPAEHAVDITASAATVGPTGVEMEALTAAAAAALTVYDMCKAASKGVVVADLRLRSKNGGKSGDWAAPRVPLGGSGRSPLLGSGGTGGD